MKIDAARVDGFLKTPTANLILLYGPDAGLVSERAVALVRAVLGGVDDPFRFAELGGGDAARLLEEATAASLTGGRRVVRVRDAGEGFAKPAEALLKELPEALVILEAGDLTPKSKLRALAEKSQAAAAIVCYKADAVRLPRIITDRLRAEGVAVAADAAAWVAGNIAGEEGVIRQTVELLVLYAGAAKTLSLEDVMAGLADGGQTSIQDAIDATLTGDTAAADRALALAYDEGVSPVAILRVLLADLMRLRLAAGSGLPPGEAVAAMRPPVFFRRAPLLTRALSLWPETALMEAIRAALAAEAACKQTLTPDEAYCRQLMLGLASRARNAGRRL